MKSGSAAQVLYFHQIDDPYSHLVVQKLDELRQRYTLDFQINLVSQSDAAYQGSAAHFARWALQDAFSIAEDFGTVFSPTIDPGELSDLHDSTHRANAELIERLPNQDLQDLQFAQVATDVGTQFWCGKQFDSGNSAAAEQIKSGNSLRARLGHYQGAMFYFEGEWYWGLDRLRLLEQRLIDEGFSREPTSLCVPQPTTHDTRNLNPKEVTLEYFPSLRSPYTAIGHARVADMIERSGVPFIIRPVMPMLMRGIPAPREKQRYILSDAAREGRAHGAPLGRIVDPFGDPVKKAFALYAGLTKPQQQLDFVSAYLQAAWFDGVDITRERGLQKVAADAGLTWSSLVAASASIDWEALLTENLNAMLENSLWGVPSFRVTSQSDPTAYACWGQDRIWKVENEIARRA